jgi:hypothetical protein
MHSLNCSLLRLLRRLLFVSWLLQSQVGWCGGPITNCTQADLQAALGEGGAVTFACSGTITLTNTLVITQDTTIDASGFEVTLSGGNAVRLFAVTNAALHLNGFTLADGRAVGGMGLNQTPAIPGQDGTGGCILNQGGTVALTSCTLSNHLALGGDAALVSGLNCGGAGNGVGGAICSFGGQINLTNCLVTGCAATGGSGGSLNSPSIAGGSGVGLGGAVYLVGSALNLQHVTLANNRATGGPGGMTSSFPTWSASGAPASGGAVYAANSSVCAGDSLLTGNAAVGGPVTNAAHGTVSGDGSGGALFVTAGASATLDRCTLSGNSASSSNPGWRGTGGSGRGGAVFNGGSVQLFNSTCFGNSALATTGSMGARVGQGGALYSTNSVVLVGCTFNNNLAQGGDNYSYGSGSTPGEGGALWSSGGLCATNCTWATNQAVAGYWVEGMFFSSGPATPSGGGVCLTGGSAALVNMTFAGNRAAPNYHIAPPPEYQAPLHGGNLASTGGQVLVQNSIFLNGQNPGGTNLWGVITDGGYNLCSDGSGGFTAPTSLTNTDPMLLSLVDNGGPTATMALDPGSPARDAIPAGYPSIDQRGVSRPQGDAADIGAVEADSVPTTLVTVETVPPGLYISADGRRPVPTPHPFRWATGSCHTLNASTPGSGGQGTNAQYLWTSWSDGGAVSHLVCANEAITNTAYFRAQYYLSMSPGNNFGGTVNPTSGWYDEGQAVSISAVPVSGFTFSGWSGSGSGTPYSGPDNPAQVTLNGWVSQTALFTYTNPCAWALSATHASFDAGQQLGTVMVSSPDTNCLWTVVNPCNWISVTSGSPSSPTVNYLVSANDDVNDRTCTLSIAGQPFTVTQAGKCVFSLDYPGTNIGPATLSGVVTVTTHSNCFWTAVPDRTWLHTTNTGTGPGLVWYTADANPYTNSRAGVIAVMDQTFTVVQAGLSSVFAKGTYHGLFYPAAGAALQNVGALTLSTTSRRTFTGRLWLQGTSYLLHGQFDLSGWTNLQVPRRGKPALDVALQLAGANKLLGSVAEQGGGWQASLDADREVFTAAHPCDFAGFYTVALPGSTNPAALPGGDGWGTAKVSGRGSATLAMSLADGRAFTSSSFVAIDGRLPLFEALYRGQGLVSAWVQLPSDATNYLGGQGLWIKPPGSRVYPDGFSETVTFFGAKYSAPKHEPVFQFTEGAVAFAGGNLPDALSVPMELLANNKAAPVGASNLWLSISASSGRFSGSFSVPPARERYRFQGVLLPQLECGYGYFLGTNQSGYVRIGSGQP